MTTVYQFPNGFRREAQDTFGWLRHYQFTPSWVPNGNDANGVAIAIPENEISQLRLLQKNNPARWGSPPNAAETKSA
jgi:hypothetical protein